MEKLKRRLSTMFPKNKTIVNIAKRNHQHHMFQNIILSIIITSIMALNMVICAVGITFYQLTTSANTFTLTILFTITLFYGCMILCSLFYLKLTWNEPILRSLHASALTLSEIRQVLVYEAIKNSRFGLLFGLLTGIPLSLISTTIFFSTSEQLPMNKIVLVTISTLPAIAITILSICISILFQASKMRILLTKHNDKKALHIKGKKKRGNKLYRIAWRNIVREKNKVGAIVGFICFGLMIWNTYYTFIYSDQLDRFIDDIISVDFFLTPVDTSSSDTMLSENQYVPESIIEKVESDDHFKEGGRLYYNLDFNAITLKTDKLPKLSNLHNGLDIQTDINGNYFFNLYGADDFIFSQLEIIEGDIDYEKLKSGNYIIYGIEREPRTIYHLGKPCDKLDYFDIGDTITILNNNIPKKYTILAKCIVNHSTCYSSNAFTIGSELTFYLPSFEYLSFKEDHAMRYLWNAKDFSSMEKNLQQYITDETIFYETKDIWKQRNKQDKNVGTHLGVFICIIFVGIGIFNYINTMITSMLSRKKEFALLECIGMTKAQMKRMILYEGIYYFMIITTISLICCIWLALLIMPLHKVFAWNYHFTLTPALIFLPIVFVISIAIPYLSYKIMNRQPILVRIK